MQHSPQRAQIITGDLLTQPVAAIVNAWNRNLLPWWLLRPHGVAGAIRRRAGLAPFRTLARRGPLPLGGAVLTEAGTLPFQGIIHVAAITPWGRSRPDIIRAATLSALALAEQAGFPSLAFPVLGSGSGGVPEATALATMEAAIAEAAFAGEIRIVRYVTVPAAA